MHKTIYFRPHDVATTKNTTSDSDFLYSVAAAAHCTDHITGQSKIIRLTLLHENL